MPFPIENPGEPDDYIAGLRSKGPANFHVVDANDQHSFNRSSDPTETIKGMPNGAPIGLGLLVTVAACVVGCAIGAVLKPAEVQYVESPSAAASTQPQPTVTITKTVTVHEMPEACSRALKSASEILEQAAVTASASDKQLDILSEAYQAILQKDWRKLNTIADKQRALERELAQSNVEFLPGYLDLKRDIDKCLQQ